MIEFQHRYELEKGESVVKPLKIVSVLLKATAAICSAVGVTLSALASRHTFMGGPANFLFFTVQSNIWIGLTCLAGLILLLRNRKPRRWMTVVKLVFTVSITLTGFVFAFLLAPLFAGSAWYPSSLLMHLIVPAAAILDYLLWDTRYAYRFRDSLWCTLPPLYYLCFAAVGYVRNWDFGGANYPYFFLNWGSPAGAFGITGSFPYLGTVYYILLLLAFILLTGVIFIALSRLRKRVHNRKSA